MRKYDYAVVIGRFQPVHKGHEYLFQQALEIADQVIVLCGSANQPRTIKNPWTVDERSRMISLVTPSMRVKILGIEDHAYNDQKWALGVQKAVDSIVFNDFHARTKTCLVGFKKDSETAEYLDMFPQYDYVNVPQQGPLSATAVRNMYFDNISAFRNNSLNILSTSVDFYLSGFALTTEYKDLKEEFDFLKNYKKSWQFTPYTPTFVTSDAVVVESGHILMIQRGNCPGKGQWALPGGFLGEESIINSAIRELHEETGLKVPAKVLRGSVRGERVFDKVDRDPRGRFITHAFLFNLPPCPTGGLTKVKGADDAKCAEWIPLSEVQSMQDKIFLDHYDIIFTLLGEI